MNPVVDTLTAAAIVAGDFWYFYQYATGGGGSPCLASGSGIIRSMGPLGG